MEFCDIKDTNDVITFFRGIHWNSEASEAELAEFILDKALYGSEAFPGTGVKVVNTHYPEYDAGDGNMYWTVYELTNDMCTHFVRVDYTYSSWSDPYFGDQCITLVKQGTRVIVDWVAIGKDW